VSFFYFLFGFLGLGNKKGKQKIWGKKIDLYVIAVAMYFGILLLLLFRPSKGSDE
jgi:Ca2+/Na+ antiporter